MCGRIMQAGEAPIYADMFAAVSNIESWGARYNLAPPQQVMVVADLDGTRTLVPFRWGLIPARATDASIGSRLINASAETVAEKPSFRDAFKRRRCLIPADGFYEWRAVAGGPKVPHLITRKDGKPLALAGLWAVWRDPATGQDVTTCTILTTTANARIRPLHGRMPVILPERHWDAWLDPSFQDTTALLAMFQPSPDDLLTTRPVSRLVNDVKNDGPQLLLPVA